MASKLVLVYAGLFLLGIVLFLVGWVIEPARPAINEAAESLIAFGLALVIAGLGFFLAYANPT